MSTSASITVISVLVIAAAGIVAILGWGASQESDHSQAPETTRKRRL